MDTPLYVSKTKLKLFDRVGLVIDPRLASTLESADILVLERDEDQVASPGVELCTQKRRWKIEHLALENSFFVTVLEPGHYRFHLIGISTGRQIFSNDFIVVPEFMDGYLFEASPKVNLPNANIKCRLHFPNYHYYQEVDGDSIALIHDETQEVSKTVQVSLLNNKSEWETSVGDRGGSYSFRYYYLSPLNELCRSDSVYVNVFTCHPRLLRGDDPSSVQVHWDVKEISSKDEIAMYIFQNGGEQMKRTWKAADQKDQKIILERSDFESPGTYVFRYQSPLTSKIQCTVTVLEASEENEDPNDMKAPEWVPDAMSTFCTKCRTPFSVMTRRHHCRHCGKIFCHNCTSKRTPLPMFHEGDLASKPQRVCEDCYGEIEHWKGRIQTQTQNQNSV